MGIFKFLVHSVQTCVVNLVVLLLIPTAVLAYCALGIFGLLLPDSWLDQRMQDKYHRYQKESSSGLLVGGEGAMAGDSSLVNSHAGLEQVSGIGVDTLGRCAWCGSSHSVTVGQGCDCGLDLTPQTGASRPPAVSSAAGKGKPGERFVNFFTNLGKKRKNEAKAQEGHRPHMEEARPTSDKGE